jgi:hypothetical protein
LTWWGDHATHFPVAEFFSQPQRCSMWPAKVVGKTMALAIGIGMEISGCSEARYLRSLWA